MRLETTTIKKRPASGRWRVVPCRAPPYYAPQDSAAGSRVGGSLQPSSEAVPRRRKKRPPLGSEAPQLDTISACLRLREISRSGKSPSGDADKSFGSWLNLSLPPLHASEAASCRSPDGGTEGGVRGDRRLDEVIALAEGVELGDTALGLTVAQPQGQKTKKNTNNPFVEYEDREQRLQCERRWLQDDAEYMGLRVRGLKRTTVQTRLVRRSLSAAAAVGDGGLAEPFSRPRSGKARKAQASTPVPQDKASRRGIRGELTALKALQKDMKESAKLLDRALNQINPAKGKPTRRRPASCDSDASFTA